VVGKGANSAGMEVGISRVDIFKGNLASALMYRGIYCRVSTSAWASIETAKPHHRAQPLKVTKTIGSSEVPKTVQSSKNRNLPTLQSLNFPKNHSRSDSKKDNPSQA